MLRDFYKSILLLLVITSLSITHTFSQVTGSHVRKDSVDLTFSGTKINPYALEFDTTGSWKISAYLDTYYAGYSDTVNQSGFAKFPTIAPRNNQFGLNIIQVSARYNSKNFRGTMTVFGGDCAITAWSPVLNYVQEANMGFRIVKKLWLDAGFFRTHIGLESIQPRENTALSLATTTYFEPYFLSGAKLTWQQSDRLTFQVNAFNSFNTFIETNKNKALGFSTSYSPTQKSTFSFSTIWSNEMPAGSEIMDHHRWYNNLCWMFKSNNVSMGWEVNYGKQYHTSLNPSLHTATVWSGLGTIKYRFNPQWATYCRGEYFQDLDEMLTGPILNENHSTVGVNIRGITYGFEYKPIPNSFVRIESRLLHNQKEHIFEENGHSSSNRKEIIFGMGLWF